MRIIPTLLIRNKRLIKTTGFEGEIYLGDPINAIKLFNDYEAHELIIVDISEGDIDFNYLEKLSSKCRMPIAYGGGIRSFDDAMKIINIGFDKVILNTLLFQAISEVKAIVQKLGSQSVIGCVEIVETENLYELRQDNSKMIDVFCQDIIKVGVGEIYLYDTTREGTMKGLNLKNLKALYSKFNIPFIVGGGVGCYSELKDIKASKVHGLACGALFVFYGARNAVLINYDVKNYDL